MVEWVCWLFCMLEVFGLFTLLRMRGESFFLRTTYYLLQGAHWRTSPEVRQCDFFKNGNAPEGTPLANASCDGQPAGGRGDQTAG